MAEDKISLTPEDGERVWKAAKSFEDICELTAQFIEGDFPYFPCYGDSTVAPETNILIPYLAAFNRAGFWTENSQPGANISPGCCQRACIDGYAPEEVGLRLAKLSLHSDLIVLAAPPGWKSDIMLPVTVDDFHLFTESGPGDFEAAEGYREYVNPTLFSLLKDLWVISVIDPKWGRNDYLWELVAAELCYTPYRREGYDA